MQFDSQADGMGIRLWFGGMRGPMGCGRDRDGGLGGDVRARRQYKERAWVRGGVATPPSMSYRSISSSRGVASPAMDMGVLSIIGLGDGRGVILGVFFRPSASFSFSHCSAILPQSTAELLLDFGCGCGCCCCGVRPLDEVEDEGVLDEWPW